MVKLDKRFAIFIPTWNGTRLNDTIASLPAEYTLDVFQNKDHHWSIAKAWNYAIRKYCLEEGYETVIIANDDIIFRPDTCELLYEYLTDLQWEQRPEAPALIVTAYNSLTRGELGEIWVASAEDTPGMHCFITSPLLIEEVGWFDENFYPAFFEDVDMLHRIRVAGWETYSCVPVDHFESTTTLTDPERAHIKERYWHELETYYKKKWGGPPYGGERYVRPFQNSQHGMV